MYNTNNEKLIAWVKRIMICAGFWDLPITDNYILSALFSAYSVFMKISYFMFYFLLFSEFVRLTANGYDMGTILSSVGVVINASKILAKVIIYLKYNILALFEDVIEKESDIWSSNNEEIIIMYKRNIRLAKIFITALASSSVMTLVLLECVGAAGMLQIKEYNKANNASVEPHLMYQTLFPLNKLEHLTWTFVIQVWMTWLGFTYNSMTHLIFAVLLIYATSQFQVLQIKLRNYVGPDFNPDTSQEEMNEKIALLKNLIREHKYIIGFVQHFNECTKYIIMLEFILTSLDMASVSVTLIKMESKEIGFMLLFFILLLVQIYLLGWNSNEIKIQSEAIADAVYESRWYLLNNEAKQLTHIIIARAQRPVMMTIGPFGPMTTSSILMVLKAAYSYVSIMKE